MSNIKSMKDTDSESFDSFLGTCQVYVVSTTARFSMAHPQSPILLTSHECEQPPLSCP